MSKQMTRRTLLKSALVLAVMAPLAQACAPKAEPTAAPAQPKPTEPKAQAPAPAKEKIKMSIATYAATHNDWQRVMAKKWAAEHPEVELTIDEVPYGEMNKKQLALLATGNLWDVSFSGIKWYPFSVVKGCFLPLDDYVAAKDPGMDDFLPVGIETAKWDGKLYGLPYLVHPGNVALIGTNLDMLAAKGIQPPTDDWTMEQYLELCVKTADPDNKVFGTNYLSSNFYDCAPFRSFGSDVIDKEGKKFLVGADPKATEAAKWITDLRVKYHVAPRREEAEGLSFQAGNMVTRTLGTYWVRGIAEEVGDKFKYQLNLHPKGPEKRGYQVFTEMFSVYSKSKYPDLAYDLVVLETSEEAGIEAVEVNKVQPTGRKSIWNRPSVVQINDIYARAAEWMATTEGPFPMPYNVRFQELQDTWANNALDVFFGEIPFEEGIEKLRKACQAVMDLPRP
ncbi:MAG: extracellular solute-binding protein [Chloroflexi bacterium]|nr:extracellular solute-binding protein [Chloroflexota bacterium]